MLRFNRSFGLISRSFGGGKPDASIPCVRDLKENKQLRDKLHLQFASEADKAVLYEQSRVRKSTALYNLMTYLPERITTKLSRFVSDTKVEIRSDDLYLPRITENGVPIYDSLRFANAAIVIRNSELVLPFLGLLHLHHPAAMLIGSGLAYFLLYRPSFGKLLNGFVLKMELVPETEQIVFQKAGYLGCVTTTRVKIDDLEFYDRSNLDVFFYRSTRSYIDKNLMFRVKSTGQVLFFDPDGCWYEQGVNHQLLI